MTIFSTLYLLRIKFYLNIQQLIIGRMQTISCHGRLANRCSLAMYNAKYFYVSINEEWKLTPLQAHVWLDLREECISCLPVQDQLFRTAVYKQLPYFRILKLDET